MTVHTEDALRGARISEVLDLSLTISALEAVGAEGLVACEDGQVLNLVSAATAAVCTVVADQGSVTKEQKVRIGVEEGSACIAPKAVDVPSVAS